jgi:histidine triad (HIT) family protein
MALVMKKAYACEGVTILQNNEPAGDQHAFHFHLHVFPRYKDDHLHMHIENKRLALPEERKLYAEKLRKFLYS